jgi:hypothetical protein
MLGAETLGEVEKDWILAYYLARVEEDPPKLNPLAVLNAYEWCGTVP